MREPDETRMTLGSLFFDDLREEVVFDAVVGVPVAETGVERGDDEDAVLEMTRQVVAVVDDDDDFGTESMKTLFLELSSYLMNEEGDELREDEEEDDGKKKMTKRVLRRKCLCRESNPCPSRSFSVVITSFERKRKHAMYHLLCNMSTGN
jgi:hypothetical protein